jgi:glycosyltransferase involved in cell wall biosynthesis
MTLLSICIPTYNRQEYLQVSLTEIVKQADMFPDVEIIVINNNSTDTTEQLVAELWNEYPKIRYFRNNENIGGDANFIRCVEEARGQYVWLFGDDEILLPGGIAEVVKALQYQPKHLLLGYLRDTDPTTNNVYPSYKEFMKQRGANVAIEFAFITRCIFSMDLWDMEIARRMLPTPWVMLMRLRKKVGFTS